MDDPLKRLNSWFPCAALSAMRWIWTLCQGICRFRRRARHAPARVRVVAVGEIAQAALVARAMPVVAVVGAAAVWVLAWEGWASAPAWAWACMAAVMSRIAAKLSRSMKPCP